MSKFIVYKAEVSEDFETGYCRECPFFREEVVEYDDDGYWETDVVTHCSVGKEAMCCDLEIINE